MFILYHVASPYGTIILIGTILFPDSSKEESGLLYSKRSILFIEELLYCVNYTYAARHGEELCPSPNQWVQVVSMVNSLYQEVEILAVVFHNDGAI